MVHTLKSSCSTIGADVFAELCLEIEKMGRSGQISEDLINGICQAFTDVEQELMEIYFQKA
jgi:HPt (histidine-containing phosphotransfer) domain-containing protein